MLIKCWLFNPCRTACYVVADHPYGEGVVVDPCAYTENERMALLNYLKQYHIHPVHVLFTHAHFDHVLSADIFAERFGLYPTMHSGDVPLLPLLKPRIDEVFGTGVFKRDLIMPRNLLTDGQVIPFGSSSLTVIHTPGHTPGSVFFYSKSDCFAFSGDTLFCDDIGNYTLPGGSKEQLARSLAYVFALLPDNTRIYSGHDARPTTIGRERRHNWRYDSI